MLDKINYFVTLTIYKNKIQILETCEYLSDIGSGHHHAFSLALEHLHSVHQIKDKSVMTAKVSYLKLWFYIKGVDEYIDEFNVVCMNSN